MTNSLAEGDNLHRRVSEASSQCRVCGFAIETELHLFTQCQKSWQLWLVSKLGLHSENIIANTFIPLWEALFSQLRNLPDGEENIALASFICWRLWKAGNNLSFQ